MPDELATPAPIPDELDFVIEDISDVIRFLQAGWPYVMTDDEIKLWTSALFGRDLEVTTAVMRRLQERGDRNRPVPGEFIASYRTELHNQKLRTPPAAISESSVSTGDRSTWFEEQRARLRGETA